MLTRVTQADAVLRRWAPSRRGRAVIAGGLLVSTVLQIIGVPFTSSFGTRTRIDLDVYRLGAQIWQQGQSLYADGSMPFTSDGIWLPFTYPPFAALGFVPLGALPLGLAGLVMSVATVGLTVVIARIVLDVCDIGAVSDRSNRSNRWWIAMVIAIGAIWLNPVWMTLGFGQINIILVALIMTDLFIVGRGRARALSPARGLLIGIAAAVKLTPLVFIAVFIAARQWRAACTAAITFAGAAALAWVWLPADSLNYWTHTLFHTTRIGDPAGGINQNLNAMWIRLIPDSAVAQQVMWVLSSLAATALMVAAVRSCRPVAAFATLADPASAERTTRATAGVNAMLTTSAIAVWGLLVSPTSWAHHWVWSIPIIVTTAIIAIRSTSRRYRVAYGSCTVAGLIIFTLGPFQFLRPPAAGWTPIDHFIGNAYSLWGIAFLAVVWLLPSQTVMHPVADDARELAAVRRP